MRARTRMNHYHTKKELHTLALRLSALVCPAVGDQEGVCACVVGEGESWYTIGLNNPPHTGQPATITRSPGTQGAVDSTSMAETADKRSRCAPHRWGADKLMMRVPGM